jgi:hypothetical protein
MHQKPAHNMTSYSRLHQPTSIAIAAKGTHFNKQQQQSAHTSTNNSSQTLYSFETTTTPLHGTEVQRHA